MKKKEMVDKNLELHYHLMMQLLQDPDSIDIPDGAEAILLPEDDLELREANLKLGRRREGEGKQVVYVSVKFVPETRTVQVPKLSVLSS
jgi:hypothetical protein